MTKNWKKITDEKIKKFWSKLQYTYLYSSTKDAKATGEAFSHQKRPSCNSTHKISLPFQFLCLIFALLDPDPETQMNVDPCWSGSETLPLEAIYSLVCLFKESSPQHPTVLRIYLPVIMRCKNGSTLTEFCIFFPKHIKTSPFLPLFTQQKRVVLFLYPRD